MTETSELLVGAVAYTANVVPIWEGIREYFAESDAPMDFVLFSNKAIESPELRERLSGEALEPMPMSPEQFGQYMREDIARWSQLAKARNIEIKD